MTALALVLALLPSTITSDEARVVGEVARAAAALDATLDVTSVDVRVPEGCAVTRAALVGELVDGTSRVMLEGTRDGRPCAGLATIKAAVLVDTHVVVRPIAAGAPVAGGYETKRAPRRFGATPARALDPDGVARRALRPGAVISDDDVVAPGHAVGRALSVRVRAGALVVVVTGRVTACARDQGPVCAELPSGKAVAGDVVDGVLEVDHE